MDLEEVLYQEVVQMVLGTDEHGAALNGDAMGRLLERLMREGEHLSAWETRRKDALARALHEMVNDPMWCSEV